jgi:hypothetical protein
MSRSTQVCSRRRAALQSRDCCTPSQLPPRRRVERAAASGCSPQAAAPRKERQLQRGCVARSRKARYPPRACANQLPIRALEDVSAETPHSYALLRWDKRQGIARFDLASARAAADDDRTASWVGAFLASEGGNEILAAALAQTEHWWAGPVRVPLGNIERLAGPEDDAVVPVEPQEWEGDVERIKENIAAGWEPPPLLAEYRNGRLLLQDGNHRFEALRREGASEAWVLVYFDDPEERDAFRRR